MLPPLGYLFIFLVFNLSARAEESPYDLSWVKALNRETEKLSQSSQAEAKSVIDQALKASTQQKHCRVAENLAHNAEENVRQNLEFSDSERHARYPNLLVFVSFSMPVETLKSLAKQVNQIGGKIVLRGLVNGSFKQTAEKIKDLQKEVIIDPTLFDEYQVKVVPTFVLRNAKEEHDQLSGNVSLEYALEQMSSKGTTKTETLELLNKLRKVL